MSGFKLEIDTVTFNQAVKEADKGIEALERKIETINKIQFDSFSTNFQKVIDAIKNSSEYLSTIKIGDMNFSDNIAKMEQFIGKLTEMIGKLQQYNKGVQSSASTSGSSKQTTTGINFSDLDALKKYMSDIKNETNATKVSADDLAKAIKAAQQLASNEKVSLVDKSSRKDLDQMIKGLQELQKERKNIQTIANTPLNLIGAQKLTEDSINEITIKIKELQRIQKETKVNLTDPNSVAANQALLTDINRLEEKVRSLKTITQQPVQPLNLQQALALDENSVDRITLKIKELKRLQGEKIVNTSNAQSVAENQALLKTISDLETKLKSLKTITKEPIKPIDAANAALASAQSATTINQRISAIKQLQAARANLDTTDSRYEATLKKVNQAILTLDKANKEATKSSLNLENSHRRLMDISGQLQRRLALVFSVSQVSGYIKKLIAIRGEFELQQRSLQAILQNKDRANEVWDKTVALAIRSPFTIKELVTYTKQMAAYRIETDKLYDSTKMLADVSAGVGVDMSRLVLAFGQVKAANFLRGQELRQFSEAGINILGELADKFTEVEGKAVTTGEVFERVSKRMVTFSDVEDVFKRLTSEGGIFFDMQAKQAETLNGMIANLEDSIDVMLNTIGQSSEGVLKGTVALLGKFVEEWETVRNAVIALGVSWVTYRISTMAATKSTLSLLSGMTSGRRVLALFKLSIDSISAGIKRLGASLKANAITLIISAVAGAWVAFDRWSRGVEEARGQYDKLNATLIGASQTINTTTTGLIETNNKLKESISTTERAEDKIKLENKANSERIRLINELNKVSPEYAQKIRDAGNDVEKITQIQNEYNKQLELTIYLNKLAKNEEGWFSTGIAKNLEKMDENMIALRNAGDALKASWIGVTNEIIDAKNENSKFYQQNKEFLDLLLSRPTGTIDDIRESMKLLFDEANKGSRYRRDFLSLFDIGSDDYYKQVRLQVQDALQALATTTQIQKKIDEAVKSIGQGIPLVDFDETQVKRLEEAVNSFIQQYSGVGDEVKSRIINTLSEKYNIQFSFNKTIVDTSNLSEIGKQINKYIKDEKLDAINVKFITDTETTDDYFKGIENRIKRTKAEIKSTPAVIKTMETALKNLDFGTKEWDEQNARLAAQRKELVRLKTELPMLIKLFEAFGRVMTGTKSQKDPVLEKLKNQISAIKDLNKEYKDYRKNLSEAQTLELLETQFKPRFKDLGLDKQYDNFMNRIKSGDLASALALLGENGGKKLATKYLAEINKHISTATADAKVKISVENVKDAEKQIERMFSGYQMTFELKELGFDQDLAKSLFDFDFIDLKDFDKLMSQISQKEFGKDLFALSKEELKNEGENAVKFVEKSVKEREKIEEKYQRDTAKKYVTYLQKSVSERYKIEEKFQQDLAKLQGLGFNDEQIRLITQGLTKEMKKQIDSSIWEDFRASDMYIDMFENIETASIKSLDAIYDKLSQMRNSLKQLSPQELREIVRQMEKIQEIRTSKNPFTTLIQNSKEYINTIRNISDLEEQLQNSRNRVQNLTQQREIQSREVLNAEKRLDVAEKQYGIESDEANQARTLLKIQKDILDETLKRLVAEGKISEELAAQIRQGNLLKKTISDSFAELSTYFSEFSNTITSVASSLENIFGEMSPEMNDTVNTIAEITAGLADMADGASEIAKGQYFTGSLKVLKGFASTIGSIFNISDKRREREIQRQIKAVEKLSKQYEVLQDRIEKAYSIGTLNDLYKQSEENLNAQAKATEKMIAAEKAKKKTSKDALAEYEQQLDDIKKQQYELSQQRLSDFGGIKDEDFRSTTESFVSAWLEAFKETGNGLSGLKEEFENFIQNLVVKQMALRATDAFMQPIYKLINQAVNDGLVTGKEMDAILKKAEETLPGLSEFLERLANMYNISPNTAASELSGLQRGIQGVTEETATALEALLNSIRFITFDSNSQLKTIISIFSDTEGLINPMLLELKNHTRILNSIDSRLSSVISSTNTPSGNRIKVYVE